MKDKSNQPKKDIPKEMRMVNREYDEIVSEANDSAGNSGAKKRKNSKNK